MLFNRNTILPAAAAAKPVQYALHALRRDMDKAFAPTQQPGGRLLLNTNDNLPAEQYTLTANADSLLLSAAVLHESLSLIALLGAALIIGSALVSELAPERKAA